MKIEEKNNKIFCFAHTNSRLIHRFDLIFHGLYAENPRRIYLMNEMLCSHR